MAEINKGTITKVKINSKNPSGDSYIYDVGSGGSGSGGGNTSHDYITNITIYGGTHTPDNDPNWYYDEKSGFYMQMIRDDKLYNNSNFKSAKHVNIYIKYKGDKLGVMAEEQYNWSFIYNASINSDGKLILYAKPKPGNTPYIDKDLLMSVEIFV